MKFSEIINEYSDSTKYVILTKLVPGLPYKIGKSVPVHNNVNKPGEVF